MSLLLHGHDANLGDKVFGFVESCLAEVEDSVSITEVGPDLGLVDQCVSDQMRVP
ncbi:hypothetical protein YW7DRAFT_01393 [Streptomyces sp. AmelKG-E11A]|nr:hypothetical protein YW7DRAFT_01393 [Streptomyces sp. AmelKG-E11A]